ncbi:MAG: hypothetical protein GWO81_01580 [Verrucomicrobia bacterium]|nr:hypothetical protein [Verrucomicrobiota bacterium]
MDEREVLFDVPLEGKIAEYTEKSIPDWAQLDYRQCRNCAVQSNDCLTCAMALQVESVIDAFGDNFSTEKVHVRVIKPQREFAHDCDLQTGIHSLLGLLMATCGCSHFEPFRMLVNFHIPFCSTEESLRRAVGAYLTQQYFVMRDGGKPDWELCQLEADFANLAVVNQDFARRLQGIMQKDAVTNAIFGYFATSSLFAADLTAQVDRQRAYLLNAQETV